MKKLSKTLLAIAAISAASMAMTASAMAMEATYTDGVVTVSGIADKGASQTLLVVPEGAETVTQDNIYQIDQKDGTAEVPATFEGDQIKLDASKLTAGATYEVRIGGTNGTVDTAEFKVPGGEDPDPGPGTTETITIGDVDQYSGISANDASAIAKYLSVVTGDPAVEKIGVVRTTVDGEQITIGDVDQYSGISANDASAIAKYLSVVTGDPAVEKVGTTVEVVVSAE